MATDLYSVLPGLEVTQDEILQAELAAEKILEAKFPDLDLRQGTGLRDLVIRPSATLLAMLNKAVAYYFVQNTISGVNDSSPTEIVDKILSNWFLERKAGKKSVISARLYFATRKNVTIGTEIFFSPDNAKKFYPVQTYSVSPSDMLYDNFSGEYYLDIDLIADKEGPEYDLSSGSLLFFSNFDPYFLRGEISFLRELASVTESNSQYITRAETAISTRNLINIPSIEARLREDFDYITSVTSIGMGDAEMYRDQVEVLAPPAADPVVIHIGGKTDVYCRTPLENQVLQYPTNEDGDCLIEGSFYELSRSAFTGGAEDDTVPRTRDVSVSGISFAGTVATVTAAAHGFTTGVIVEIAGASPALYNGSFAITVLDVDTFTYTLPSEPASVASGTILAKEPIDFVVENEDSIVRLVTSITNSMGTVTVTCLKHGFMPERVIEIFDAVPDAFNGWFKVLTTTRDTFTVQNLTVGLPASATGSPLIRAVSYLKDRGLSPKQTLRVKFGAEHANKTASFSLKGFQGLDGIQTYLEDGTRKVLAGEPLVRAYNVYLLSLTIVGYNGPPPSASLCASVVNEYLAVLGPGEPFIMADLIARLNEAGVITIKTPIGVNFRYFNRDLSPVQTGTIADVLEPNDRTAIFMLENLTTSNEYL